MALPSRPRKFRQKEATEQLQTWVDPKTFRLLTGLAKMWNCSKGAVIAWFTAREMDTLSEKDRNFLEELLRRL